MDVKKKIADAKEKCKKHAPVIITGAATVTAVVLAVVNQRLKNEFETELASRCNVPADRSHIQFTEEVNQRLVDGKTHYLSNPHYDFRLAIHKELPTED